LENASRHFGGDIFEKSPEPINEGPAEHMGNEVWVCWAVPAWPSPSEVT
jgi:hypothetical protein